jgi:hypothetical protein
MKPLPRLAPSGNWLAPVPPVEVRVLTGPSSAKGALPVP